jgi:hypothetical protein
MSALSPLFRISASRLMSAIIVQAKTFNNYLSFEQGLWKFQTMNFAYLPKTSVFGAGTKVIIS